MQPNPIHLFEFDINSLFARVFKKLSNEDGSAPKGAVPLEDGTHVYCLKPVFNLLNKEIRAVNKLGIENTHIVLVFDHEEDNFRHEIFSGYKGSREEKCENWKTQLKLTFDMFKAMGYPCLKIPGVEADDVLNTLAKKLNHLGHYVTIFTGDKDMMSCCQGRANLYLGRQKQLVNHENVKDKFGVPATKILDLLALMGDSVDDVPGVPGIGEMTARKLLLEMEFDELMTNPDKALDIKGIRGLKGVVSRLKEHKELALMSRKLVEMKDDVKLGINVNEMKRSAPDYTFLDGFMRPDI